MADHIRNQCTGVVAVFAYGSSLRDSTPEDTLIDFYVVVESSSNLASGLLLQRLGEIVPPNVCYAEAQINGRTLRSKFALITLHSFEKLMTVSNPYLWARFAQPTRLVWSRDKAAQASILRAVAKAVHTAYGHGLFLSKSNPWVALFQNTYRTELRPESGNRAESIVAAESDYYAALSNMLGDLQPIASSWRAKQFFGKLWSLARLGKNAFTFSGGADYAAWKIERHSGLKITVTDWQRRHPFLAGILILPKLLFGKGLR